MSDSDTNTDVLLLIPPDFFLVDSSDNESTDALISFRSNNIGEFLAPKPMYTNSNSSELQSINARLSTIENCFATGSSDITSISTSTTVKPRNYINFLNEMDHKAMESPSKLNHSTPKYNRRLSSEYNNSPNRKNEGNVLRDDIDRFLLDNKKSVENNSGSVRDFDLANKALMKHNFMMENNKNREDEPLLSLNEMWGPGGQSNEHFSLQEERLRREHCEKSIQVLQSKCLEYQQKISVALKIDRTKDDALTKLHENNTRLAVIIQRQEDENVKLKNQFETERNQMKEEFQEIKQKNQILENEIFQAIEMAKKFQEKNEVLELKADNLKSSSGEIQDIHKKQIVELEIRLSNSLQNEKLFNTEVSKLKYQIQDLMEEVSKNSFCKKKLEETESELVFLTKNKENSEEKLNRLEFLEKSKRSDQQIIENLLGKEKSLMKELENQRIGLKSYYQAQLEQVVTHKLKEFQEQLDSVEETLKNDAKIRERTIAERALKQMELINQKNEEELSLLTEKQTEEITLYRIQLANSSKTIDHLQEKLNRYESRRADIAEKLHTVMETQWQKALAIITSPSSEEEKKKHRTIDVSKLDMERVSNLLENKIENEIFQTPTSSRYRDGDRRHSDKLQAYIELLLKKSPRDLEKLDELLQMPKKSSDVQNCSGENNPTGKHKPPWK